MWEKFSYYGMRAILVYYMTKELRFSQPRASVIYGTYTALIYFSPLIGAVLSDRFLRRRQAILLGGAIMAAGHFMMTFPALLFPALAAIVIGNGFYLPNLPSQIGDLYAPDDPRRSGAYTIYYAGVNVGGFLAPLVCGSLGEWAGWHYGFAAAGIGLCLGLTIYLAGAHYLPPDPPPRARAVRAGAAGHAAARPDWRVLAGLWIAVVIFRAAYEQSGNTVALWIDTGIDRQVGGFTVPGSWFQALYAVVVLPLTPVFVRLWQGLAAAGREPPAARKMAAGAGGTALVYAATAAAVALGPARPGVLLPLLLIVAGTACEMAILPVGLATFAQSASAAYAATGVALWFLASFAGSLAAGFAGALWPVLGTAGFFLFMAACAGLSAALLWRLGAHRTERA